VYYEGERIELNRCPRILITSDILDLFRVYQFADGKLALSEQAQLPNPYLQAWDTCSIHYGLSSSERMKKKNG